VGLREHGCVPADTFIVCDRMRTRSRSQPKQGDTLEEDGREAAGLADEGEGGSYELSDSRGELMSRMKVPSRATSSLQ
jgi:hypothetical protein